MRQSYSPLEIIIADNCSTDNTEELVKSYDDPRIRYIRHETPLKPHENFNFCVFEAKGEYILLLHDDDLIDPDFVEICINKIDGIQRAGIIRTGTRTIDGKGNTVKESPNYLTGDSISDLINSWFEAKTSPYMCSTLFHVEKLKELGGFHSKTNLYLDVVLVLKLAAQYGQINIMDIKASFRRHEANNGTAQQIKDWNTDCLYLLEIILEFVPERQEEFKKTGLLFFARQNYVRAGRIPNLPERWLAYLKIYRAFDFRHSPFHYWIPRIMKSKIRSLKRRFN